MPREPRYLRHTDECEGEGRSNLDGQTVPEPRSRKLYMDFKFSILDIFVQEKALTRT